MQYLLGSSWHGVAYYDRTEVAAFECGVLVAELACGDNLSGFNVFAVAGIGNHFLAPDAVVFVHERAFVDNLLFEEAGVARVKDVDLAHHLAYDYFKVLVVDLHTLHAVHVLNFVDDVFLNGCRSHDVEDVGRSDGTVGEGSTGAYVVVFLNEDLLGQGHEVFLDFTDTGCNGDFTVTAFYLSEVDFTVDFGYDCGVGRVTGFEELSNTGQTTGDVTCASGCTRYLDKDFTGFELGTFVDHQVSAYRECVCLDNLSVGIEDIGFGNFATILGFDYNLFAETCLFVGVNTVCYVFDEVEVLYLTTCFADDNGVEGVPFANHVALGYGVTVGEVQFRTVGYVGVGEHHLGIGVDDTHFSESADNNLDVASASVDFVGLDGTELVDFECTFVA